MKRPKCFNLKLLFRTNPADFTCRWSGGDNKKEEIVVVGG